MARAGATGTTSMPACVAGRSSAHAKIDAETLCGSSTAGSGVSAAAVDGGFHSGISQDSGGQHHTGVHDRRARDDTQPPMITHRMSSSLPLAPSHSAGASRVGPDLLTPPSKQERHCCYDVRAGGRGDSTLAARAVLLTQIRRALLLEHDDIRSCGLPGPEGHAQLLLENGRIDRRTRGPH